MEYSKTIEIDVSDWVNEVTFTANNDLVSGGSEGVQVWRVKDGGRVATMKVEDVYCVAVSKDGRFIAAGSGKGDVLVWDGTYKQIFAGKIPGELAAIFDVDFSPNSSRLVSADWGTGTATVWAIAARKKVRTLHHGRPVQAAKYSPHGDRIATAAEESVRVWDNDEHLLVDVKLELKASRGLLWFNDHLFVKTKDSKIKQIDAATGSTVSEWSVPYSDGSCIDLPHHRQFIAYSTSDNVTFWDISTHTQLALISRASLTSSIAFSPNDRLCASVLPEKKIIIKDLSLIGDGPEIHIDDATLDAWQNGQLPSAEALLTAAIPTAKDTAHHVLASRALVRARLKAWDAALIDAEESIEIQSSVIGYIAKCVALVGKGDIDAACRVCDVASLLFHSDHVVILLIKAVVLFVGKKHDDAMSRMDDLIAIRPLDQSLYVVQAYMYLLLGNLHMGSGAIQSFEDARLKLGNRKERPALIITLISGWKFEDFAITIQQRLGEALLSAGRVKEAGKCVLCMLDLEANMTASLKTWISDVMQQCLSVLENNHDVDSATATHDGASLPMTPLLKEWVKLRLSTRSWKDALIAATNLTLPKFTIYQAICEHLEVIGQVADAVACFHHMCSELAQEVNDQQANWTRDFKSRCGGKLEELGDIAMNTKVYNEAISQYTTALSLRPPNKQELLVKRSTVCASKGEWDNALKDANEVIRLDPDSPLGYERRHAALHCKGDHKDAIAAYGTMLLKMSESTDPQIREQSRRYVTPEVKRTTIRTTIKATIRDSPPVLIDTIYGRLCNKSEQASAFENTPTFAELISSMTTHIDHARIGQEVGEYFRYATFSHNWEENEPLFEKVMKIVVYDLEASPANKKLQMFCKLVRELGFNWAWSDTCCINKGNHFVLQEALVSMFEWYERAAMTLIYLRGVDRLAKLGALTRSIWNQRAWTLQEYHASKVVRIYTEDWTPYLDLDIYNYKESPEIISEMEEATGISAQALMALRPGLDDIREKLQLASTRQTTRVEDAAYSLLGIFSASLPITYGEGDRALGRLLAQLLTNSGDMSILAWAGRSGGFNSCLPSSITVFSQLPTTHIPLAIPENEIGTIIAGLRSVDLTLVTKLYDHVNGLAVPSFSDRRMKLPCLSFKLGQVSRNGSERVFRAQTNALGIVEIQTHEDLSQLDSLCLVHPWLDFLLDRQPVGSIMKTLPAENITDDGPFMIGGLPSFSSQANITPPEPQTRAARLVARFGRPFGGRTTTDTVSLLPPSTVSPSEKQIRVLQFVARLRQPFGALLLTPTRRNVDEYRRVAAESLITVQVRDLTPAIVDKLMQGVRLLDVL